MLVRRLEVGLALLFAGVFGCLLAVRGQETAPPASALPPTPTPAAAPVPSSSPKPEGDKGSGVEVLARGPVHEAFASLTGDPVPTRPVPRKPPAPLDELPPEEKPEGDVIWISGYWAWDDERSNFLWVSGTWRTPPPGKQWVAGYWREEGDKWQWVRGFWTATAADQEIKEVTYLPQPPEPPQVAPPGRPPTPDTFYVPGAWVWTSTNYAWRAGYWARVQPGYVWVADYYQWTPSGYVFIPGYWDLALSRRGILYAPVVVAPEVVTVSFSYTPVYAVSDTILVDSLFVQPACGYYYFGDYYGPTYTSLGYESVFVYSGRRYDSIVVYETWAHRSQPNWFSVQIDVFNGRSRGVLPSPPRTLVQQNTIIQQNITNVTNVTNVTNITRTNTVVAPAAQVAAARGVKTVALDASTRQQARQQAAAVQQVAQQRTAAEKPLPPGAPRQARVASLSVPKAQPVQPGFVAPRVTPQAAGNVRAPQPFRPAPSAAPAFSAAHPSAGGIHGGPPPGPAAQVPHHPGAPGVPHGGPAGIPPYRGLGQPAAGSGQPGHANPALTPRPAVRPPQPPARRPPPKDSKDKHDPR